MSSFTLSLRTFLLPFPRYLSSESLKPAKAALKLQIALSGKTRISPFTENTVNGELGIRWEI